MKEKLKKVLDTKGYIYTDWGDSILIEFHEKSFVYKILENGYSVYVFDTNDNVISKRDFKQAKSSVNYILKF